jgi:hypothetical protein
MKRSTPVILGIDELRKLATARMAPAIAGVDLTTHAFIMADASRRPGCDWLRWTLCAEQDLTVEEAQAKVDELIKAHRGRIFAMSQMLPLHLVPHLVAALGTSDPHPMNEWLERPLPEGMVRTLLVAGEKLGFGFLPVPVVS